MFPIIISSFLTKEKTNSKNIPVFKLMTILLVAIFLVIPLSIEKFIKSKRSGIFSVNAAQGSNCWEIVTAPNCGGNCGCDCTCSDCCGCGCFCDVSECQGPDGTVCSNCCNCGCNACLESCCGDCSCNDCGSPECEGGCDCSYL